MIKENIIEQIKRQVKHVAHLFSVLPHDTEIIQNALYAYNMEEKQK